jgi:hypothetical protein
MFAARALELHQGRPVVVEAVEDFGVDGIGGLDALLVIGGAALGRKLRLLCSIEVGEGPRHDVAVFVLRRIRDRLEEPPADDLESLFGARRAPGGLYAPHHVTQPVERLPPSLAAYFHIVRLRMR